MKCAIGFRIKTGNGIAIVVARNGKEFKAIDRRTISLCDPALPTTRQPYHVIEEIADPVKAEKEIARLCKIVRQIAKKEIVRLLNAYKKQDYEFGKAALVVGSVIDPQKIGNPHVRAHASEGKLFRTVVEEALTSAGVLTTIFPERDLLKTAVQQMEKTETELKTIAASAGRNLNGPWRADEKNAFLAASLMIRHNV
jgi:hypothetical protein